LRRGLGEVTVRERDDSSCEWVGLSSSGSIFAELVAQIPQFATERLHLLGLLSPRIEDLDRKALVVREIDGRMAVDSTLDLFDDQMPANMKGRSILELLRLLPVQRHAVLRCLEVDNGVRHGRTKCLTRCTAPNPYASENANRMCGSS
jgi:hypothetical protein